MNRQLKLTQIYDELIESRTSKKIFFEEMEKLNKQKIFLGNISQKLYNENCFVKFLNEFI